MEGLFVFACSTAALISPFMIPCLRNFFILKEVRRQGIMEGLIKAAVEHAKTNGAQIVEAYPIDMQSPKLAGQTFNSYSGYMGVASAFRSLGFEQVGRASETQLIVRLNLADRSRKK